ncbi:ABC transporter permease [Actinobacteria bacterium IMCC26103]|nr:ABC transporter permease [Actinobacteria bacterium IMCC26103]
MGKNYDVAPLQEWSSEYFKRVKSGDMGALPGVLGLIALCIVFGAMSEVFLTPGNFANLLTQAASVMVIAMGLIFVLLLGEIDLSAGFASGVCGAVLVILITNHGVAWWVALSVSILFGALLGLAIGILVSQLGIPSFVVTLAAFLMFQGLLLLLAGEGGTIRVEDPVILSIQNSNLSPLVSWLFFAVLAVVYVIAGLTKIYLRSKKGLKSNSLTICTIKTSGVLSIFGLGVYFLNLERSNNPELVSLKGMPYVVVVILFLLIVGTFVLNRTRYGRHLYAVGGNPEAARRAGINVKAIRTSAFVICSSFAAVAGMLFASRQNSISPTTGGSATLLYAVGAAVIGGTSLFGGKGRMSDAVLGGFVVAIIDNGMGLLGYAAGIKFIVTGLVLLISSSVDALTRKKTSSG